MSLRYYMATAAAAVLALSTFGAGSASADPPNPKDHEAYPPHRVHGSATTTWQSGYQPSQLVTAYRLSPLACSGSLTCGAGQTIAIVDAFDDPTAASDLAAFDTQFGLPCDNCFQKLTPQGQPKTDASWALEESLDVQWAHAIAPGAKILLVEATSADISSLLSAVDYAVGQGATAVSMSWGSSGEFATETLFDSHFSAPGVTFTAASGDSAQVVSYPAVSPYVTAVGGTTLPLDAAGNPSGDETAWSGSGGGVSVYEAAPSYQSSLGKSGRSVPDVAYDADPSTGFAVYDSTQYVGQSGWFVVGGTSAGAPQWAALAAIANGLRSSPLGGVNGALYALPATDFRDIGAPAPAAPGYDTVTGLGSPFADLLVLALAPSQAGGLSFSSQALTTTAGTASGPIKIGLSGAPTADLAVMFKSSSAAGSFATSTSGPWSSTLSVTVPAGNLSTPNVYYEDTKAGSPTVTASASGYGSANQAQTIAAGPLASLSVTPGSATVPVGATQRYTANGADTYGNAVTVTPSWSTSPALGSFSPNPGSTSTFTASTPGSGTVTATVGSLTATSTLAVVTTPTVRVSSVTYANLGLFGILQTTIALANGGGQPVSGASVSILIYRNGTPYATGSSSTASTGKVTFSSLFTPAGCYSTTVTKLTATGYTWDGTTPANQFCK